MKQILVSASLLIFAALPALAETVDEALAARSVTEQQLDDTAEKMIAEEGIAPRPKAEAMAALNAATKATPAEAAAKAIPESQIPVLRDIKAAGSSGASTLYRLMASAIFVLAVAAGLVVFVRKTAKQKTSAGKKAKIEVLHQHFFGPKKGVALIQVAGEAVLIGITDHNVTMLKSVALIDDEVTASDFNGFLEEEFTVETLTAQKSRNRIL